MVPLSLPFSVNKPLKYKKCDKFSFFSHDQYYDPAFCQAPVLTILRVRFTASVSVNAESMLWWHSSQSSHWKEWSCFKMGWNPILERLHLFSLISMRAVWQVSSQHWLCIDAEIWCKEALMIPAIRLLPALHNHLCDHLEDNITF